jgi:chromosome segregation ATPase
MSPITLATLLFTIAFLIGFFLLYWRKGAQEKKYLTAIEEQEALQKENRHLLQQTEEKMQHAQGYYDQIHAQYREQSEILQHLHEEEAALTQDINALEEEQKSIRETRANEAAQIETLKEKITDLTKELDSLKDARVLVAKNETEITALDEEIAAQKVQLQNYLDDIENLKKQRKRYREGAHEIENNIFDAKAKLHKLEKEIGKIEAKYAKTLKKVEQELEEIKIRAINYEYAVKEYLHVKSGEATKIKDKLVQKLFKMPDSKSKEIEEIVRKNDASRWIDTIKQTVLKKAAPSKES